MGVLMARDKIFIVPYETGKQDNVKPFLIPDDAFEYISNAIVFRSRVIKRPGMQVMNTSVPLAAQQLHTRLGINIGNMVLGNFVGIVPLGTVLKVGVNFSVGNDIYTVTTAGLQPMLSTSATGAGTFDTATGVVTIADVNQQATAVYFYPTEPVQHDATYDQPTVNDDRYIFFDTRFAYEFLNGRFERLDVEALGNVGASVWAVNNGQFYKTVSYRGVTANNYYLFVLTDSTSDNGRYFDGTQWFYFTPTISMGNFIKNGRGIAQFKGRLIIFGPYEGPMGTEVFYGNRARYSWNGNPIDPNAFQTSPQFPTSGYIDADTKQEYVGHGFIKDRLIVGFGRSVYEFVYTGNANQPFAFQRINSELGIEAERSIVEFDQNLLGIGENGINKCNSSTVERIDEKIPDIVFNIRNTNSGLNRVCGIRDYFTELVYWTFNDANSTQSVTFPNRVLIFNYRNGSWSTMDDSITMFGNIQLNAPLTWEGANFLWRDAGFTWANPQNNPNNLSIVAGNQQGFVFLLNYGRTRNAQVHTITNIEQNMEGRLDLTIYNHNLETDDYIRIENVVSSLGNLSDAINENIYPVEYINADLIYIYPENFTMDVYLGGGTFEKVTPIDILTKQFNKYLESGVNMAVDKIDFHVDRTERGLFNVNWFVSSSDIEIFQEGFPQVLYGDGTVITYPYPANLAPTEQSAARLWHAFYPSGQGEFIQILLYLTDQNIRNPDIAFSPFVLHGMILHVNPTDARLQ